MSERDCLGDWGDVVWLDTFDWAPVTIETPGRRGMFLGGALRGRSPRTREGRIGPTAQLQWLVVSGQWRGLFWRKLEWELAVAWLPPEVCEISPYMRMHGYEPVRTTVLFQCNTRAALTLFEPSSAPTWRAYVKIPETIPHLAAVTTPERRARERQR